MFRPPEYALLRIPSVKKEIEMATLDELVRKAGFESEKEFHGLIASFDLSTPKKYSAFKKWQEEDGTKEGLLKLDRTK